MSAGRNIAIGCGVIVFAMFVAGFLGIRWVQNNLGITVSNSKILTWSEEMIGMVPPPQFEPVLGIYTDENQFDAVLVFELQLERGSDISLVMMLRSGSFDFDSVWQDVDTSNEGVYIKFQSKVGEGEDYFASWGDVQVPVRLEEGYDGNEQLSRQITGLIPVTDNTVILFFDGPPGKLDRDIVQEMLDRIPADWKPQNLAPLGVQDSD